jgi:hypothetical protein
MRDERFTELSEAMAALSWSHPFWSTMIYDRLTLKITGDEIPTAATDGKYLYINKEYFTEKCDSLERIFALAHETGHAMWMHPEKWKLYQEQGFDGEPFDVQRMNMAADFVLNAMLVHTKVGKIKRHSPPQPGDWLLSKNVVWTDSVEEVYRRLKPPKQPPQDGQGGEGSGPSMGTPGPNGGTQSPQGGQPGQWTMEPHPDRGGSPETFDAPQTQDVHIAMHSDVSEMEWKATVEAAVIGAKAMGNFHQDLDTFVKEFIEPKRNWKQILRDFFVRHRGRDRRDWRRANKRKMHSLRMFVPRRHSWKVGRVLIISDRSGSVSQGEEMLYKGAMSEILTDCTPKELRALSVTTEVTSDVFLKNASDLDRWEPKGTGGTDMEEGFRYVIEDKWIPDIAVVLTDGYTPFNDEPPFPVIWVSTGLAEEKFPYGRAVMMED